MGSALNRMKSAKQVCPSHAEVVKSQAQQPTSSVPKVGNIAAETHEITQSEDVTHHLLRL